MPVRSPSVSQTLDQAIALLDELGLRYAVVGGLAVGAWGVSRSTDDVDIFAELPVERRKEIRRALVKDGFTVPAMAEELSRFGVFRSRSARGTFLDLFDAVGPLGEAVIGHRRRLRLGRRSIWFVSPEELVILKAFSERDRDFEDLSALVAVLGRKLDRRQVREWGRRLDHSIGSDDVSRRLEKALSPRRAKRSR